VVARRILLAWELGAGLGHLMPMRLLAATLRRRGHRVFLALRDLQSARRALGAESLDLLQAPVLLGAPLRPVKVQLSYASLLHNCGFDDTAGLTARLQAWRTLVQSLSIDALVAVHAPTALAAASSLRLPAATLGTGFVLPPAQVPFPPYFPEKGVREDSLQRNEAVVLGVLNGAMAELAGEPLPNLATLFRRAHPALLSYPELDHYMLPRSIPYLGQPDFSQGLPVRWGPRPEKRVFAYLRPFPGLHELLLALQNLKAQVLVHVGDLDPARLKAYLRPGLVVSSSPAHLRQVAADCDAYVGYAPHGSTAEMLLAGKPGLLIPNNVERQLVAQRAQALGAALVLPQSTGQDHVAALQRLLEDSTLRGAAEAFARRHAAQDRSRILEDWTEGWLRQF
jgi:UDP:flavonoid glycosyltransferase YjiC (YdhE family)